MKRFVTYPIVLWTTLLCCAEYAHALPPLGLSRVGDSSGANLEIINDSAYIGLGGSIYRLDSRGDVTVSELVHPEFGTPSNVTRVVEALDGQLYVGANFGPTDPFFVPNHAALFRLDETTTPVVTWERDVDAGQRPWLLGVDRSVRGVGNVVYDFSIPDVSPDIAAAEFQLEGSIELLEHPQDAFPASVTHVSAGGYALGDAHVPGTIGSGVALWTPHGSFSFVSEFGVAGSLRDRLDGEGVNVGYFSEAIIKYGEEAALFLNVRGNRNVIVSHSDFALLEEDRRVPLADDYFAYFPGIVPDDPTQALPLFEVFPELAAVNFDRITDLAAVDGYIYMTLHGEDGLYLFGARDPSVIPEPSAVVLAVLLAGGVVACRRSMFRRNPDASAVC